MLLLIRGLFGVAVRGSLMREEFTRHIMYVRRLGRTNTRKTEIILPSGYLGNYYSLHFTVCGTLVASLYEGEDRFLSKLV